MSGSVDRRHVAGRARRREGREARVDARRATSNTAFTSAARASTISALARRRRSPTASRAPRRACARGAARSRRRCSSGAARGCTRSRSSRRRAARPRSRRARASHTATRCAAAHAGPVQPLRDRVDPGEQLAPGEAHARIAQRVRVRALGGVLREQRIQGVRAPGARGVMARRLLRVEQGEDRVHDASGRTCPGRACAWRERPSESSCDSSLSR